MCSGLDGGLGHLLQLGVGWEDCAFPSDSLSPTHKRRSGSVDPKAEMWNHGGHGEDNVLPASWWERCAGPVGKLSPRWRVRSVANGGNTTGVPLEGFSEPL